MYLKVFLCQKRRRYIHGEEDAEVERYICIYGGSVGVGGVSFCGRLESGFKSIYL